MHISLSGDESIRDLSDIFGTLHALQMWCAACLPELIPGWVSSRSGSNHSSVWKSAPQLEIRCPINLGPREGWIQEAGEIKPSDLHLLLGSFLCVAEGSEVCSRAPPCIHSMLGTSVDATQMPVRPANHSILPCVSEAVNHHAGPEGPPCCSNEPPPQGAHGCGWGFALLGDRATAGRDIPHCPAPVTVAV